MYSTFFNFFKKHHRCKKKSCVNIYTNQKKNRLIMTCSETLSNCAKDCSAACKKSADVCKKMNHTEFADHMYVCMRSCEMLTNLHEKNDVDICKIKYLLHFCKKNTKQCAKHCEKAMKECENKNKNNNATDSKYSNKMEILKECHVQCEKCSDKMEKALQKNSPK